MAATEIGDRILILREPWYTGFLADGLESAQMEPDIKGAVTATVKRQDIGHYDHYFFSPARLGACSEQYCYGKLV